MEGIEGGCAAAGGFPLAATRPCLRPDMCPYSRGAEPPFACPDMWGNVLAALMPGDPDLAREIVDELSGKPSID